MCPGGGIRIALVLFLVSLTLGFFESPPGISAGEENMAGKIDWPPEAAGWKWDREGATFKGESLYDYIDGAAEVYLAYNYRQASVRRYVKPNQPDIIADVYQMGSSEDAFGVFSLEHQDPEAGIGQGSEFGGSLLRFWKGRYFVTVAFLFLIRTSSGSPTMFRPFSSGIRERKTSFAFC
jgi:hypothetical protein